MSLKPADQVSVYTLADSSCINRLAVNTVRNLLHTNTHH